MRLSGLFASVVLVTVFPVLARERLPTVDVFTTAPSSSLAHLARPDAPGLSIAHEEERLGVPTFVWGDGTQAKVSASAAPQRPEQVARGLLERYAPVYRLERTDADHVPVTAVQRLPSGGGIVTFGQRVEGIEVFRQSLKVLLDSRQSLVAMSGHLSPVGSTPRFSKGAAFILQPREAIARAYRDLEGHALPPASLAETGPARPPYQSFELSPGPRTVRLRGTTRTKPVYYPMPDALVPAYYVELGTESVTEGPGDLYAYVIAADDGRLLVRHSLTRESEAFTYKVWADTASPFVPLHDPTGHQGSPHPTGLPDGYQAPLVAPNLVTLRNAPFSRNDPWLAPSATRTEGNNVEAYADLVDPYGEYGPGDLYAVLSEAGVFSHGYDHRHGPSITDEQQMAGITHAFYVTNFLHDWFYDSGFDEAAGNAQHDNFGRGGLEEDSMVVGTQVFWARNNAMMDTPADGARPLMTLLIYDNRSARDLYVQTSGGTKGPFMLGFADYGPQVFDVSANAVLAVDGVAGGTVNDACEPLTNAAEVQGKVAVVDGGRRCDSLIKAMHAQQAGAIAVLSAPRNLVRNAMGFPGRSSVVTIPVASVTTETGALVRAALEEGDTTLRLVRGGPARDGALDSGLLAHEWMHYMSNRLVGDGVGLFNGQGASMGEGWSDFAALLLKARAEDAQLPANAHFSGVYVPNGYIRAAEANQAYYWGVRRYPYTTDLGRNPLTFRFIQDGVSLPEGIPFNGEPAQWPNAEFHNSGEVWAVMLWECYVALLRDTERLSFAEAQSRMKDYLVASLKLTPVDPTFLEARDALLAAALARDSRDFELFSQAFARRGAGLRAVAPHRDSLDHAGVVESFYSGKDLSLVRLELIQGARSCDDDGILDAGEQARVRLTVRNAGTGRLERSTLTATSDSGDLIFPEGSTWSIPPSDPFQEVRAEFPVELLGGTSRRWLNMSLAFRDEAQTVPGDQTASLPLWVSRDEVLASSATETVDAERHPWRFEHDPSDSRRSWVREVSAEGGYLFHAPNLSHVGLRALVSPPLQAATDRPLRFTFRHRHDIETYFEDEAPPVYLDGAVIELSTDDGQTWTDLGEAATPTYNAFLEDPWGYENPLAGRSVYSARNSGYPAFETVSVDLGMTYAGQTVRVRFLYGTDFIDSVFATIAGWDVDDLHFEGLVNTPFTTVVDDAGLCLNQAPVVSPVPEQEVNEESRVEVTAEGTDPEGAALTYAWTQTSGPPVTLEGATTATVRFTGPKVKEPTEVKLRVVASDGKLQSAPVEAVVRIRDSKPDGCDDCASGGPGASLAWLLTALGLAAQKRRPS
ncbi:hypothetical protein HUA78_11475 [Myxococcus sp. CA033]|uniref:myxosortase-dependent M36 family metallopeptidase n=1 Tax=Myxococcus sp. CA033 TaxID=2741516 RepID=UPI00157A41B4|nr:myxosortase-dependent M36 family metallopeptidase [Myxococcus sp. CA033]NTX35063.1 hypothetical protein [Myxococcus sp. CA033]